MFSLYKATNVLAAYVKAKSIIVSYIYQINTTNVMFS